MRIDHSDLIDLNNLNTASKPPIVGDVLVIKTRKSGDLPILAKVKDVVNSDWDCEIILNFSTNSYFIFGMYLSGQSWVTRVWNLGQVHLTASTNSMHKFIDV